MFDALLRPLIDPPLNAAGRRLAEAGIGANAVTVAGLVPALGAGVALAQGAFLAGLVLILLNRLLDGLDGAVARARGPSDFGGYLDTVADYVFYVAVPVGFGLAAPENAVPALILVASFTLTGASFLVFAALAAKRGLETRAQGRKSFFYAQGLAEGAETIAAFVAMCLFPPLFGTIALAFAVLCLITVLQRTRMAHRAFTGREPADPQGSGKAHQPDP